MEGEEVADPLELNKNPQIIKDAQEEIGKLDVLVCGECHDVFHHVEAFQEHRQQKEKCTKVSTVRDNYKTEPKAQIWAFMLWKCAQQRKAKEGEPIPTSWAIYQRWCKLNSDYKDAWVVAGHAIQSFTKLSTAKVQEIKTKAASTPVRSKTANVNKNNDEDPLEEGEIRLSQLTNAQRVAIKAQVASNKANLDLDPLAGEVQKKDAEGGDAEKDGEKTKKNNDATKKTSIKPVQIGNDATKTDSRKALHTTKDDTTEEATVDKIVSRRFNHKKKCLEYLIKWENMNESENTWEPKPHLEKCRSLMEEFDRLFNKPKANAKLQKRLDESHSELSEAEESTIGRPQRTSKQKALNQVKVWCGDITEGDEASGKRKSFSDDDSSDSFEKKIKLEEETDSSEDEKPSVTIRRVIKSNSLNGVAKKPDGTLNTTPQRVLRVSQKQLPSLSSGVYIMSKTEGIIKLDSNTPPTVSNPLLRVGPKIGQTHIKVVKKDGGPSSNIQKTPTKLVPKLIRTTSDTKTPGGTMKPMNRILQQQRKISTSTPKLPIKMTEPNVNDKPDPNKDRIDEDSDGLEELEFPTDLPLPPPDSPPGDFTLCPLTGKLVGQDYTEEKPGSTLPENTSLDNLVKEAVAELPDIDVDTDTGTLVTNDLKPDKPDDRSIPSITVDSNSEPTSIIATPLTSESSPVVTIAVSDDNSSTATISFNDIVPPVTTATTITALTDISTTSIPTTIITTVAGSTTTTLSKVTPTITKPVKSNPSPITTAIISNSKIPLKDDLEECIASNTIQRNNSSSLVTPIAKPKPKGTTSILNAALTNTRVTQSPSHVGPSKKLLSTPIVRQKVTTPINRSPISRPSIARPSPTATIIQKVTPSRQRTVLPKTVMHHPDPVLKRTSNVNTYGRSSNVSGKIGGTTIYKASEKPQLTTIKKIVSAPVASTVSTIVATIAQPTLVQASQPPALIQTSTGTVINMPLLTTDEEQTTSSNNVTTSINEIETLPTLSTETGMTDLSTFSLTDSETPLLITGDDGTVYQVAGQNEEGQTILISEGPDGQQQCVLVSSEPTTEESQTVMMDTGSAEPDELEQALMINTQPEETEAEVSEESNQVVAQIIKADPPSPGGTRKVVLMLPDGNLMMTDVTAEQYAALELDK